MVNKEAADLLLTEMKSCFINPSQEVIDIIRSIFGPATTTVKTANVQKLRQYTEVCKSFSSLLPTRRTRTQPKDDDDFVVVPPKEKPTQVLTEHQKEVRRSRHRSSNVPALYSDLSQSSQQTESQSQVPESQRSDPAPPQLIVVSSSSIVNDEDAMMKAPTTAEASSSVQTDGIVTPG